MDDETVKKLASYLKRITVRDIDAAKSLEEGEECVVVCVPATLDSKSFIGNVIAKCYQCGVDVIHRPHVPEPSQKVCMECAIREGLLDSGEAFITPQTVEDVESLRDRKN